MPPFIRFPVQKAPRGGSSAAAQGRRRLNPAAKPPAGGAGKWGRASKLGWEENGQVTVLTALTLAGLVSLLLLFMAFTAVAGGKAEAQNAADFSALAAAKGHFYGTAADPCAQARQLSAQYQAAVVRCEISARQVEVQVSRKVWSPLSFWQVQATARAGPARPVASGPAAQ